jgi:hypothetical protein
MSSAEKIQRAFSEFDQYNSRDPHLEQHNGKPVPKELLYAMRMSEQLDRYEPNAADHIKLAARCQHIGRWEIPRNTFPMDRKGYLQWRSKLAIYHTEIASRILTQCGFDQDTIDKVKFLLQKKQLLQHHPDTQILEDVICLVFIEHYLHDFALAHDDDKVIDILQKTIRKMSPRAIAEVGKIPMTEKVKELVGKAVAGN